MMATTRCVVAIRGWSPKMHAFDVTVSQCLDSIWFRRHRGKCLVYMWFWRHCGPMPHRIIILRERLAREREESDAIIILTDRILTSLETARSLANGPSWGGGGEAEGNVCILRSPLKFSSLKGKHASSI